MTIQWLNDGWRDHIGEGPIHFLQTYFDFETKSEWNLMKYNWFDKVFTLQNNKLNYEKEFKSLEEAKIFVKEYK
jgi:hypothetical protein